MSEKNNSNNKNNLNNSELSKLQGEYDKENSEATKIISFRKKSRKHDENKISDNKLNRESRNITEPSEDSMDIFSSSDKADISEMLEEDGMKNNKKNKRNKKKKAKIPFHKKLARFFIPMKGDKPSIVIQKLICILMTVVCLVSAGYILNYLYENVKTGLTLSGIQNISNQDPTQEEIDNLPPGYLPGVAKIYAINQDYKGWVKIEGTPIDYPLLQCDDNEYYLKTDIYKQASEYGNPFIDFRNVIELGKPLSDNTILYGHNVRLGTHFSAILKYQDLSFYKEHPVIEFDTPFEEAKWKIVAAFEAMDFPDPGSKFDYSNYINKASDDEFMWFVDEARKRSFLYMDVDVKPDDKLITLSTCDGRNVKDRGRFVVIARKVRPGESAAVDTSGAYKKKASHILRYQLFYNAYPDYPAYNPVGDPRDGTYTTPYVPTSKPATSTAAATASTANTVSSSAAVVSKAQAVVSSKAQTPVSSQRQAVVSNTTTSSKQSVSSKSAIVENPNSKAPSSQATAATSSKATSSQPKSSDTVSSKPQQTENSKTQSAPAVASKPTSASPSASVAERD